MKKATIIILSALILTTFLTISTSFAGSWNGWIYQNPYPTGNTLLSVKFITPQKGWVVGEHGTILYTEDGGESWEAQESGTEEDLKSVIFLNERLGWVVGNGGVLIHTEDGGKKWERQGKIRVDLHNIFFINEKEGWAGGMMGTFLHTKDGGKNWNKEDIGAWSDIANIFFLNPNTGWVLSGGEVYRTKDGGKNWEKSELPPVKMPESGSVFSGGKMVGGRYTMRQITDHGWEGSVFFIDEKKGWATVSFNYIFSTEDGGKTWKATEVSHSVDRIFFTDEKNGCIAGSTIFCTEDGGTTWDERLGAKPGDSAELEDYRVAIWGLSFVNRTTGWAVGAWGGPIFKTEDGGKSWKAKSRQYAWDFYFLNSQTGWARVYKPNEGSIVKTEDGGKTWVVQKAFDNNVDLRFFFINTTTGWVAKNEVGRDRYKGPLILNYSIIHTNDGGKMWITQFKEPGREMYISNQLLDIFFINPDIGWVGGYNGMILHTKDGGKHWEKQKSDTKLHITKIRFIDDKNGIAIADNRIAVQDYEKTIPKGIILYTDDGGEQWHKVWEKKIVNLQGLFFIDKNTIWIFGNVPDGELFVNSTDSGKTWMDKVVKEVRDEFAVACFADNNHWVLFTDKELMFITTDGGKNWVKKRKPLRKEPWHCKEIFQ